MNVVTYHIGERRQSENRAMMLTLSAGVALRHRMLRTASYVTRRLYNKERRYRAVSRRHGDESNIEAKRRPFISVVETRDTVLSRRVT